MMIPAPIRKAGLGLWLAACLLPCVAAEENAVVFNLDPTKEHPRNSEGAFQEIE